MNSYSKVSNYIFRLSIFAALITTFIVLAKCAKTLSAAFAGVNESNAEEFLSRLANNDLPSCASLAKIAAIILLIAVILSFAAYKASSIASIVTRTIFLLLSTGFAFGSSFIFHCADILNRNLTGNVTAEELKTAQAMIDACAKNGESNETVIALLNIMGAFLLFLVAANLVVLAITSIISIIKNLNTSNNENI